jgi:hypothetical protein
MRENNFKQTIASVKIKDEEEVTEEKVATTLRRAVHHISALQSIDGHWPALHSGPLFYMPPMVSTHFKPKYLGRYIYVALNIIFVQINWGFNSYLIFIIFFIITKVFYT